MQVVSCPTACACKWKGGKQTVECPEKELITIPTGIDPGTQVLELSGNNLKLLPRERFERMGLLNLQRIYLSRCKISQIDDRAFRGLTNLVELDLSLNMLSTVPTETFVDYPSLMRLIVSGNPIRALQTASFRPLSFLTSLELSNCQIESIEDGTFLGLDNLEWLKLDGNRLNFIRGERILPDALHGVALERNPWQCDCRLLEVHNWLLNYKIPHAVEPKCAGPARLIGEPIRNLEVGDLACLPDVSPTTLYLEIAEGKNISLLCRVSAIPEASVSWWFQGRILQNDTTLAPGFHFYYFVEEGREEKRSELFIFNTNPDDNGTFVCAAENPAGKSLSNYTIRIIVKEEPVVGLIVFSREYLIAIFAVLTVSCFLILMVLAFLLVRCRKQRRKRRKKERNKEIAVQNRKPLLRNEITASPTEAAKTNGTLFVPDRRQDVSVFVSRPVSVDAERSVSANVFVAVPPNPYPVDRNPDLIDGTESVGVDGRTDNDPRVVDDENVEDSRPVRVLPNHFDPRFLRRIPDPFAKRHHTADVHLSPGRFLDGDGYPVDFGLPKVPLMVTVPPDQQMNFYRTLPHKRPLKPSAGNPAQRFAREAEFLSRTESYDYDSSDVRYTIEGYPCNRPPVFPPTCEGEFLPSPPAAYKTDLPSAASDGPSSDRSWHDHRKKILPPDIHPRRPIAQCSVAAQTNPLSESPETEELVLGTSSCCPNPSRTTRPLLTESPDEGYVGDATESAET